MHPNVKLAMRQVLQERLPQPPQSVLDVGGLLDEQFSLLQIPETRTANRRVCLNLDELSSSFGIVAVTGNANHMTMFDDDSFDLVVSNATLEHDPCFWLSVAEMHRVLRPEGLLVIGVPGFRKNRAKSMEDPVPVINHHGRHDYYRFSPDAMREVLLAGMTDVAVRAVMRPPRLVGSGYKRPRRATRSRFARQALSRVRAAPLALRRGR